MAQQTTKLDTVEARIRNAERLTGMSREQLADHTRKSTARLHALRLEAWKQGN